jgi:phospholipid/cholesterol/gamma-HCH transport system substrate-binding protein
MENKSHALAAGLFVLVVSGLVVALAMWLTRDNGDYLAYEMTTRDGVSGLQPQAAVRYKGVAVGKVTHIGFDPQVSGNVLIRIAVDDDAPITPTTFATLGYQGVTGLSYILLDDAGKSHPPLPPGVSGLPRLPLHSSPFAQLSEQGPIILGQVQEVTKRVNQLLSDDNQKHFADALAHIGSAAASVDALTRRLDRSVTERLDPALAALPALAKDAGGAVQSLKKAGYQIAVMADTFGQTAQRLGAPGGPIEQAAHGVQTFSQAAERLKSTTLPSLERAADDTGRAARQISRTAAEVSANPQGFIYGSGQASPGPGEPGFVAPARNPQ